MQVAAIINKEDSVVINQRVLVFAIVAIVI
jgi:hypothetical protein